MSCFPLQSHNTVGVCVTRFKIFVLSSPQLITILTPPVELNRDFCSTFPRLVYITVKWEDMGLRKKRSGGCHRDRSFRVVEGKGEEKGR